MVPRHPLARKPAPGWPRAWLFSDERTAAGIAELAAIRPHRFRGTHDLPNARGPQGRIQCEQFVQECGTATRHSNNENGPHNRSPRPLAILQLILCGQLQPRSQKSVQMNLDEQLSERMKVRLPLEAQHQ